MNYHFVIGFLGASVPKRFGTVATLSVFGTLDFDFIGCVLIKNETTFIFLYFPKLI